jgi:hypothetical protein
MQLGRWEMARASLNKMRERTSDPLLVEQVRVELAELERRREQAGRPPLEPKPPERQAPIVVPPPEPPKATASGPVVVPQGRTTDSWPPPGTLMFLGRVQGVECGKQGKILTVTNRFFLIRVRERAGAPAQLYYAPKTMRSIPCSLKNVEVEVVYRPLANFGALNGDVVAVLF